MTFYIRMLGVAILFFQPAFLFAGSLPDELTIFYNNDVHGETEPCG